MHLRSFSRSHQSSVMPSHKMSFATFSTTSIFFYSWVIIFKTIWFKFSLSLFDLDTKVDLGTFGYHCGTFLSVRFAQGVPRMDVRFKPRSHHGVISRLENFLSTLRVEYVRFWVYLIEMGNWNEIFLKCFFVLLLAENCLPLYFFCVLKSVLKF